MGNTCKHEQTPDQSPPSVVDIKIFDKQCQAQKKQALIKKYSTIRSEVSTFPIVNTHVQQAIKKLSRFKSESTKIWRLKSPYNVVYMNQFQQDQNQLPKGYVKMYKIKQSGEFAGYYQGKVLDNFSPDLTNGFFVFKNASYFEGTGRNQGVYTNLVTNLRYQGKWINQQPHGKGSEHNSEGFYEGQYFQGQKHGQGKFVWKDSSYFQGTFSKGNIHGKGIYKSPSAKYSYEGEYFEGLKHGEGVQHKASQIYSGLFYKNQRCGKGKLQVFQNESKKLVVFTYQGMFENNKPHGLGTYVQKMSQKQIRGIWQKGTLKAICQ